MLGASKVCRALFHIIGLLIIVTLAKGWSRSPSIAYLIEQAGKHFDPESVKTFLRLSKTGRI